MTAVPATPHPAATVTFVRDATDGIEVLMLQRSHSLRFMPGAYVFPGGAVDKADGTPEMRALCAGLDDAGASRALGIAQGGLAYWVAAIREAFEEAGMLLARDAEDRVVSLLDAAGDRYRAHRRALEERRGDFGSVARSEGLRLATDSLIYFGHWITPVGAPRRYDTRFFLAVAPENQVPEHDNHETIAHAWMRPADALVPERREALGLRFPTIRTLERFAQFPSVASLVAALGDVPIVEPHLPRISRRGERLLPGDPGYEEAGTLEGQGTWQP